MFNRRYPPSITVDLKKMAEAVALQDQLRRQTSLKNDFGTLHTIAGVDVSHSLENVSTAAIVLLDIRDMRVIDSVRETAETDFPYIPGFLSFREIPVICKALEKLSQRPDLLIVDGQGVAHPRRMGIAAHLGVVMDMPAIGVAKSRLTGRYTLPGPQKGDHSDLMDGKEKIGAVLRSKINCLPLFISPGHKIDHETALELTLRMLTRYRLPEPTRLADKLSKVKEVAEHTYV